VWRIDPDTNEVVARIPVGSGTMFGPQWMAAGAGSVWVGVPGLNAVVRIDTQNNVVVATIPVPDGGVCGQLIADDDAVWVAPELCGNGSLTRIDPSTDRVVAQIESPLWTAVFGGTLGFGSLWLSTDGGTVELDPATNVVLSRLTLEGHEAFSGDMATDAGSLWIHDANSETVFRIEPPG
jgi:virginiamycin B lyase